MGSTGSKTTTAAVAGRFEIGEKIAGERTGELFRARDLKSGGAVAVKRVLANVFATDAARASAAKDLGRLATIEATGIAKILDHGIDQGFLWFAMEWVDATALDDLVSELGPLPAVNAVDLVEIVGEALGDASKAGVIHRDLAAKNVLAAPDGTVKVINFPIAVPTPGVPGVPEFVAPEQIDGSPVDLRSSVYSLGVLLYYVMTGQTPYGGDTKSVHRAHKSGGYTPPSALVGCPGALDAVIAKALSIAPVERFMTIPQFLTALRTAASSSDAGRTQRMESAPAAELLPKPNMGAPTPGAMSKTILGMAPIRESEPSARSTPAAPAPAISGAVEAASAKHQVAAVEAQPSLSPKPEPAPTQKKKEPAKAKGIAPATEAADSSLAGGQRELPTAKTRQRKTGGKRRSVESAKRRFRETLWFKKGELDAVAAKAAASKGPQELSPDKADSMPIDERYDDDGSLTDDDRKQHSLRTGGTDTMAARSGAAVGHDWDDEGPTAEELISDLKAGRGQIVAGVAAGVVVFALLLWFFLR